MNDSDEYLERKQFFSGLLTIYGRKPVQEALSDSQLVPYRLHLADSNQKSQAIQTISQLAKQRGAEILFHSRDALSRISKNRRQDQGVVLDIEAPCYQHTSTLSPDKQPQLIAFENVTNPQNVGMAIRSVAASPMSGLILPKKGNAPLDALVIKASAGTLFKSSLFYCETLLGELTKFQDLGYTIAGLTGEAKTELQDLNTKTPTIFVLGNETTGLSKELMSRCDKLIKIPMSNQVESLNVSVAASIVAYRSIFQPK